MSHPVGSLPAPPRPRMTFEEFLRSPFKQHEHRLRRNYVDGPADLAIEIVSPDSMARDREVKRREYEEGGVPEYWLIDPLEGRASFLAREEGQYLPLPVDAEGAVHSRVLPGMWLKPEWLLARPRPEVTELLRAWGVV